MHKYAFSLKRVIDGDTIDGLIDLGFGISVNKRIRLLGINAPEIRLQSKIKCSIARAEEKKKGLECKAKLQELLNGRNKKLIIETERDKSGKYGRVLGTIFVEESGSITNINNLLLLTGYVKKY